MNPNPNDIVSIIFKNGIQLDGIVFSWSDTKAVLKSKASTSTIIIQDVNDILFIKILDVENQFNEIKDKPIKTPEDINKLSELKSELNNLERQEIREQLKSHTPTNIKETSYGLPDFIKSNESSIEHSRTQNPRKDFRTGEELQKLFSKTHKNR